MQRDPLRHLPQKRLLRLPGKIGGKQVNVIMRLAAVQHYGGQTVQKGAGIAAVNAK